MTDKNDAVKIKLVKRSMYGRGKFDMLRQRVLYIAS
jgi:transposase